MRTLIEKLLPSGGRARGVLGGSVDEPPAEVGLFGGLVNARPVLDAINGVQAAPDPIAQGRDTPSRPSRMPISILTHDQAMSVQEDRFVAIIVSRQPLASVVRGRLQPDTNRANLMVPPHIAYGSLFVGNDQPYGLG